jgi:3-hydroxyisobutyrate dehydrogenase
MKIGAIGLGIMGGAMARRLLDAGHELVVWNRSPDKATALLEAGAIAADSPAGVAGEQPAVVFLNVSDTPDVEELLFGERSLASAASPGMIVVDNSTINPVATQRFAETLAAEHGVIFVDAPVSGGDVGARDGTLSIMVGGPADAVATVRPLLELLGKSVVHLGGSGMGQACKACNQIAAAGALLGAAEAVTLAAVLGLDQEKMIEVVSGGAAGSWQLVNLGPKMAGGDWAPGFMIDYLIKDLSIVRDAAGHHGLELKLRNLAEDLLRQASAGGDGDRGTQAVVRQLRPGPPANGNGNADGASA